MRTELGPPRPGVGSRRSNRAAGDGENEPAPKTTALPSPQTTPTRDPTCRAGRDHAEACYDSERSCSASIAAKPMVLPRSPVAPVMRAAVATASATAGATSRLNTDGMM